MAKLARNAACPCGSGRKYKHCCLPDEQELVRQARLESELGGRIAAWSARQHGDELETAFAEFQPDGRPLAGAELQLFVTWFNSDRELRGGGTPVERYAARPELDRLERELAARVASARLGLHRVRDVAPGRWIELEGVLDGAACRVQSHTVSLETARWDVLLARVMPGEPLPSLWGPVLTFLPSEEPELLAELARLAAERGLAADPRGLEEASRAGGRELARFVPPSRLVERSFFTAEGDPLVLARAVWRVADPAAAFTALDSPPELLWMGESEEEAGDVFQLTADRAEACANRPPLPPGALCFESSFSGWPDRIGLGTFVLDGRELRFDAVSEARLAGALEVVARLLGDGVELVEREVSPFEPDAPRPRRRAAPLAREIEAELLTAHYRRWLDGPLERLGGASPRKAACDPALRAELELLLRGIENRADRAGREGETWPDVGRLREELGLAAELAA